MAVFNTSATWAATFRLRVHADYFRVSVIHRTLTWTTGCLMCVRDHSYACVCTQGLGTLGKFSQIFLVFLVWFEPWVMESIGS